MNNIGNNLRRIDKILEVIPFLKIFIFLVIGVAIGMHLPSAKFAVILSIIFALGSIPKSPFRQYIVYLSLIALGVSLPALETEDKIPEHKEYSSSFIVRDTTKRAEIFQVEETKTGENILLLFDKGDYPFCQGDTIKATVLVAEIKLAHYQTQQLATIDKVEYTANVIDYQSFSKLKGDYSVKTPFFKRVNNWCEERLKTLTIDSDNFSIINGMLLGNKENISKETKTKYSNLGVSHILAISGMHILIIFFILNILFLFANQLFIGRVISSAVIISILILYTLIVGSPISAVRATIMFALYQISNLRPYSRYQNINTLFAAATMLILFDSESLTDIGFILSFSAVLSILIYFPLLNSFLPKSNFITNTILLSIAAQMLTTPIVLYFFGYFSTVTIFSNFIMTITAMLLICLSIIHIIAPNPITNWLINQTMDRINVVLDYMVDIPYSHINELAFSGVDMVISYLIIGIFTYTLISSTKNAI